MTIPESGSRIAAAARAIHDASGFDPDGEAWPCDACIKRATVGLAAADAIQAGCVGQTSVDDPRLVAAARAIGTMNDNGSGEVAWYNRWSIAEVALAAADAVEPRGDREDRLENALRLISEQRDEARAVAEKLPAVLRDLVRACRTQWDEGALTRAEIALAEFEKLRASAPVENRGK